MESLSGHLPTSAGCLYTVTIFREWRNPGDSLQELHPKGKLSGNFPNQGRMGAIASFTWALTRSCSPTHRPIPIPSLGISSFKLYPPQGTFVW